MASSCIAPWWAAGTVAVHLMGESLAPYEPVKRITMGLNYEIQARSLGKITNGPDPEAPVGMC